MNSFGTYAVALTFVGLSCVCSVIADEEAALSACARTKADALGYLSFACLSKKALDWCGVAYPTNNAEACHALEMTGQEVVDVVPGFYSNHPPATHYRLSETSKYALDALMQSTFDDSQLHAIAFRKQHLEDVLHGIGDALNIDSLVIGSMPSTRLLTARSFERISSEALVHLLEAICILAPLEMEVDDKGSISISFHGATAWDKNCIKQDSDNVVGRLSEFQWFERHVSLRADGDTLQRNGDAHLNIK